VGAQVQRLPRQRNDEELAVALQRSLLQCLTKDAPMYETTGRMRQGGRQSSVARKAQAEDAPRPAMNEPLTDQVLVERAKRGDAIAFSELVTRHYRRALRVAYGLLKSTDDAEDVVQDAFARVHLRLGSFEGSSAFYTWLYRIVVNLSIDAIRRRQRERRVDLEDDAARDALKAGDGLWPRFDDTQPLASVERAQLGSRLRRALAELPEIHQAVILLRELEGMSYEEIARTLHIKKGTVMSRLFHARHSMQQHLEAETAADHSVGSKGKP
jgi:RNA polymerase sigma-70 factor (ECF subfamily)